MSAVEPRPVTAREGLFVALAVATFVWAVARDVDPGQVLDGRYDPDTLVTFTAFERNPTLAEVGRWYVGDGPNGMHTYRPLQYTMLRLEFALFGRTVWPYQVVNLLLLVGCAAGVGSLLRACESSSTVAALGGLATLAWPTEANQVVVEWICTRSEVLCGLGSIWAAVALAGWLDHGGGRRLAATGQLLGLAFLSKEWPSALAAALVCGAALWPAPPRRRVAALAVIVALSLLWLALFNTPSHGWCCPPT